MLAAAFPILLFLLATAEDPQCDGPLCFDEVSFLQTNYDITKRSGRVDEAKSKRSSHLSTDESQLIRSNNTERQSRMEWPQSICDVMMPLFVSAQKLMGQEMPSSLDDASACTTLKRMYWGDKQGLLDAYCFHLPENQYLYYMRTLKGASCAVLNNLAKVQPAPVHAHFEPWDIPEPCGGAPSFIYVREPLSHFISGFAQTEVFSPTEETFDLVTGSDHFEYGYMTYREKPRGTVERATGFIGDVVTFRIEHMKFNNSHEHWFPMIGLLREHYDYQGKFSFVGRTESLEADWEHVRSLVNDTLLPWDAEAYGGHVYKIPGAKESMETAVSTDMSINLALGCAVLLPDYACLGYSPIVEAQQCVDAGFASNLASWYSTLSSVRQVFCPTSLTFEMSAAPPPWKK